MLRKMLLVTPEYFERLGNSDNKTEIEDAKKVARLLKHKNKRKKQKSSHDPYDTWFKLRYLQDPILRRSQKRRQTVSLTLVA
jgi:hypothetical protein